MDKKFIYNSKYGLIKEDIRLLPNRRFIPSTIYCTALNYSSPDFNMSVGGAGISMKDSILSTLGEFAERYTASKIDDENYIYSSYKNLKNENIIDISILNSFYSEKQYDTFEKVRPIRINDNIKWSKCIDLFNNKEILIPNYCIYLNQNEILNDGYFPIYSIPSTGLSAHSNEKLAIESGFLENVERHSFCDFWYLQNYKKYPVYDAFEILKTFNHNKYIQILYNNPSVSIRCYDLTSICNIPTFLNIIIFKYKEKYYITSGASSKFSYEAALIKSIIEAYQGIELSLWLDKKYKNWKYNDKIGSDITDFHKHFAFYNSHIEFRSKVPVLLKIFDSNFSSDIFKVNNNIITSFNINELKKINEIKNIYYKNITNKEIKELGFEVVKVIVSGFHQLTGNHNYPLLGSFPKKFDDLFVKYPHFFP